MASDKKTILAVEDDKAQLQALREKLTREGFAVLEAADGEEGLALALSAHPDLVLLDIMMPKVDGGKMLARLREDAWGKDIPVIILTNLAYLPEDTTKGQSDEYLLKSDTKLEGLVEKIRQHLKL